MLYYVCMYVCVRIFEAAYLGNYKDDVGLFPIGVYSIDTVSKGSRMVT